MSRPEAGDEYGPRWAESAHDAVTDDFEPWRPSSGSSGHHSAAPQVGGSLDDGYSVFEDLHRGNRVSATRHIGGSLLPTVPKGTEGEVLEVEHGLLSDQATVRWDNGYTETVDLNFIKRETGWY
ncbi:hypothetical protein GCM10010174_30990 [Kutzneria viridogrisea]|uniref:DUF4314 domain-containing protein n=2 Tax=Kutzneria TaxID=43356 RepID=W5VYB1_9PSEU|nr:hypothetical protein [Kutzneria albida]AHH93557.1 hypothetical protein KALB_180 [Kutzneria albida DSM 43870]MBA8929058.1 hypothetical protein [Kutzneria viridogrisea]